MQTEDHGPPKGYEESDDHWASLLVSQKRDWLRGRSVETRTPGVSALMIECQGPIVPSPLMNEDGSREIGTWFAFLLEGGELWEIPFVRMEQSFEVSESHQPRRLGTIVCEQLVVDEALELICGTAQAERFRVVGTVQEVREMSRFIIEELEKSEADTKQVVPDTVLQRVIGVEDVTQYRTSKSIRFARLSRLLISHWVKGD